MPTARRTDPHTSHEAAASVTETTITATKQAILGVLEAFGPATDGRIRELVGGTVSDSGLRTRRRELCNEGRVIDTGMREQLASGRWAIVWGLPESMPKCPKCGRPLRGALTSAQLTEGRCPIHGWQTFTS